MPVSRWSSPPTQLDPRPPRPACSCTCGCHRAGSPTTTTPLNWSPAFRSRRRPTRRICLLARHGKKLGITLLEQLLDTRRPGEVRAGVPARVRLGDGWVNGPVELFDDLVRLFPPLFPTLEAEDPDTALEAGRVPALRELRLHNGTVWRWNRPVYDVQAGRPAVAYREPSTAQRTDCHRHDRQCRLLLRTCPRDRRQRPRSVETDAVRGGRARPAPRGTRWAGG